MDGNIALKRSGGRAECSSIQVYNDLCENAIDGYVGYEYGEASKSDSIIFSLEFLKY